MIKFSDEEKEIVLAGLDLIQIKVNDSEIEYMIDKTDEEIKIIKSTYGKLRKTINDIIERVANDK